MEWTSRFAEGRSVPTILESQDSIDLIVMGSHGRTGLNAAVLGNTAYSVLRKAEVPVLAIRRPEDASVTG